MTAPPAQAIPFPLRMPRELRDQVEARAKANGRSSNSEIVAMVAAALEPDIDLSAVATEQLLAEVVSRLQGTLQLVITPAAAKEAGIKPKRK